MFYKSEKLPTSQLTCDDRLSPDSKRITTPTIINNTLSSNKHRRQQRAEPSFERISRQRVCL